MSAWQEVYSDTQRAAVVHAGGVLKLRPWRRITELAAAGQLPDPDRPGETVDAFDIPESSARSIAQIHARRSRGLDVRPELAAMPARDRAHALQLRLSGLVDHELARLERVSRNGRALDVKRCQELARALREMATLPDPKDMRLPRTPGDREPGTGHRPESRTRDSLAGALLRSHARSSRAPAQDDVRRENSDEQNTGVYTGSEHDETSDATNNENTTTTSNTHNDATHNETDHETDHTSDAPCYVERGGGAGLVAELVSGVERGP